MASPSSSDARWRRAALVAALVYVAGASAFLIARAQWPTSDLLVPPLILVALSGGRGWAFVVDWMPFLLLIFVYEGFRGLADNLNTRVHIQELIDAERTLFGGTVPTVWLQDRLFTAGSLAWYDWAGTFLHAAHFAVPVALGFAIWLKGRALYWRYVVALMGLFLAGFITYFVYPAAPPWLASDLGYLPPVERVVRHTLLDLAQGGGFQSFFAYPDLSPNPVAALPSLHGAVPAFAVMVTVSLLGRKALPLLLYPLSAGIAFVYLGEHYFVDILLGWVYAAAAFYLLWLRLPAALERFGASEPGMRLRQRARAMGALPAWAQVAGLAVLTLFLWTTPIFEADAPRRNLNVLAASALPEATAEPGERPAPTPPPTAQPALGGREPELASVDCSGEVPGRTDADDLLSGLAGEYAVYIQGLDSDDCLALTSSRSFEPLSEGDLELVRLRAPSSGETSGVLLPQANVVSYVRMGEVAEDFAAASGLSPDELYAVVVRAEGDDAGDAVRGVLLLISRQALKYED